MTVVNLGGAFETLTGGGAAAVVLLAWLLWNVLGRPTASADAATEMTDLERTEIDAKRRRLKEETLEQVRREDREGQGGFMHGFRQGLREFHSEAEAIVRLERDVETLERLPDSNPAKRAVLRAARIRLAEAMSRWDQL